MARVTGLEPATSGVTGRRSNQLSYSRSDRPHRLERRGDLVKAARNCIAWNCAAPEPHRDRERRIRAWWAVTGSNRRPSRCKRDALPLS